MKSLLKPGLALLFISNLFAAPSLAQSPQDRAREIAEWRANCNDPDPDLRLAFLEVAVETGGTPARICTMAALSSDDADMRELGLRSYLAGADRIRFEITMPPEYFRQIEAARDDNQRASIDREWFSEHRLMSFTNSVIVLQDKQVSSTSPNSQWDVVRNDNTIDNRSVATLTLRGDRLAGSGSLANANVGFNLDVRLSEDGNTLSGTLVMDGSGPFGVSARLN